MDKLQDTYLIMIYSDWDNGGEEGEGGTRNPGTVLSSASILPILCIHVSHVFAQADKQMFARSQTGMPSVTTKFTRAAGF